MSQPTQQFPVVIYKRPEGEKITLNKPLPLKNLNQPTSADDCVTLALSNPMNGGWVWRHFQTRVRYGKFSEVVKDRATDSEALVSYELMENASIAQLVFKLVFDEKEQGPPEFRILSATIFATNSGDSSTERLIMDTHFSSPLVLMSGEELPVDRSIFAVPLGSNLKVCVQLTYLAGEEGPCHIRGSLSSEVPENTSSEEMCFAGDDGSVKLSMTVYWSDFMMKLNS